MTKAVPEEAPFRILAVCTGNVCRSPMVEQLLAEALGRRFAGQFVVGSAGTGALVGNPIDPRMAGYLDRTSGTHDFSARQLSADILAGQDLVLALTREHRSDVVGMAPALLRKTFTLREFADLVTDVEVDPSLDGAGLLRAAIPRALRARATRRASAEDDDVPDPYRSSEDRYRRAAELMTTEVERILAWLDRGPSDQA